MHATNPATAARRTASALRCPATGLGLAALTLPCFASGALATRAAATISVVAVLLAAATSWGVWRWVERPPLAWLGALLVAVAAVLLDVATRGAIVWMIAVVLGAGVGFASPRGPIASARVVVVAALGGVAVLVGGATWTSVAVVLAVGAAFGACAAIAAVVAPSGPRAPARHGGVWFASGATLLAAGLAFWIGANDPSVAWFGPQVNHGPRSERRVAITFDDGPNERYTLKIRDILDVHGVKATFFTVGKALDARPDISRALLDDGQLLGNHSYHHDSWRWLDPRYPELARTQRVFKRRLGVCPALYRPPHGQRTPFLSHLVDDRGMKLVMWDVSAADWATTDARVVADRVVRRAKPGSIILLHDGLDGDVTADRKVLLGALPRILDGLERRGLQVVRLDKLLGVPGYLRHC